MTDTQTAPSGNHCFVCGQDNPQGMRIVFRMDGNICRGEYTVPQHQCGFEGVAHGGIVFSLLDDAMANWLYVQGESAYTARCEIRYREPAATAEPLLLESEQISRRGRRAVMQGRVRRAADGKLLAEAEAVFVVIGPRPRPRSPAEG